MTIVGSESTFLTPLLTGLMTSTTTCTTTTMATTIFAAPLAAESKMAPTPASAPAKIFTPPFFPRVYAGNKRPSVASSEQPAKKLRQAGNFRPRIHCLSAGVSKYNYSFEPRYHLPSACAIGKRQPSIDEPEYTLKARVLKNKHLYFIDVGEVETLGKEDPELEVAVNKEGNNTLSRTSVTFRPPIDIFCGNTMDESKLDFHIPEPIDPLQAPPVKAGPTSACIIHETGDEDFFRKTRLKTPETTLPLLARLSPSPPAMSFDEHDDSPTDEDKPVSPKKSILSKAAFKRFLVRAGIKWRHGKDKKDKKDKDKGKSLAKKEKKEIAQKETHQSGHDAGSGDNEDPKSISKKKIEQMGKGGLSRKSKSKASVRNSHDQISDAEYDKECEPRTRQKATRSPLPSATPISPDADMNDPVNEADNLSIHSGQAPADEKPTKSEKSSPKEYSGENIERQKKRLSILSTTVETIMDEDLVTSSPPPSVRDIDMYVDDDYQFQADDAEKDTDIVSVSSESMDLDDDRTIRDEEGGEIYAEAKENDTEPSPETHETDYAPTKEPESTGFHDDSNHVAVAEESLAAKSERDRAEEEKGSSSRKSEGQDAGGEADDSEHSAFASRQAVLIPADVLTPPPTPPPSSSSKSDPAQWILWGSESASTPVEKEPTDPSALSPPSSSSSFRRRISCIFKQTLNLNEGQQFNPLNISRHAYRDQEEDEETECDDMTIAAITPLGMPDFYCAWEPGSSHVDSCLQQLEQFTMAC